MFYQEPKYENITFPFASFLLHVNLVQKTPQEAPPFHYLMMVLISVRKMNTVNFTERTFTSGWQKLALIQSVICDSPN